MFGNGRSQTNHEHISMENSSMSMDMQSESSPKSLSKKRKRAELDLEELEIRIEAPEPPSKKALRRARKGKAVTAVKTREDPLDEGIASEEIKSPNTALPKRSEYGIWIGNLLWSITKADIRSFITTNTDITDEEITRLHMPSPSGSVSGAAGRDKVKQENKGFAYVDFATKAALMQALALSEKLLRGRRVLIKDSKSFEGRPEKPKQDAAATAAKLSGKPPSRRIFIGNLAFDVSKEDLQTHFAPCGAVTDVHVATFEDSGKCKGYAWVEFAELQAGEAAIRGWVSYEEKMKESSSEDDTEDVEEGEGEGDDDAATNPESKNGPKMAASTKKPKAQKPAKPRKWWVNKLKGRVLRMEFAEDKSIRYKKRYGKEGTTRLQHNKPNDNDNNGKATPNPANIPSKSTTTSNTGSTTPNPPKSQEPNPPPPSSHSKPPAPTSTPHHHNAATTRKKFDAHDIKRSLPPAPRLTGGIILSQGTKKLLV